MSRGPSYLLKDDGIIDELAVEIAASGGRKVRLTLTEQRMAVERMLKAGASVHDMCARLGTNNLAVKKILAELGQEIVKDGRQNAPRVILPVDRPRKSGAAFLTEALQALTEHI